MDRMPNKDLPDTTADKGAAEQQAAKIKAYWAAKGRDVNVWVDQEYSGSSIPLYVVRSNISDVLKQPRYTPWER